MMLSMKERVTISVEPDALKIAHAQVETGEAPSVSAAIEDSLRATGKRQAVRRAIELWEAEYGPISEEAQEWARKELTRVFGRASSSTQAP